MWVAVLVEVVGRYAKGSGEGGGVQIEFARGGGDEDGGSDDKSPGGVAFEFGVVILTGCLQCVGGVIGGHGAHKSCEAWSG